MFLLHLLHEIIEFRLVKFLSCMHHQATTENDRRYQTGVYTRTVRCPRRWPTPSAHRILSSFGIQNYFATAQIFTSIQNVREHATYFSNGITCIFSKPPCMSKLGKSKCYSPKWHCFWATSSLGTINILTLCTYF